MNHRLHLKFEQLDLATTRLLAAAEALGDEATRSPGPGQWSAAQVVHHLLFIESNIVRYVDKKLLADEALPGGTEAQPAGSPPWVRRSWREAS